MNLSHGIKHSQPGEEIWLCGHTRKCKWSGNKSDLVRAPHPDFPNDPSVTTDTCPKCGNNEFYVKLSPKPKDEK